MVTGILLSLAATPLSFRLGRIAGRRARPLRVLSAGAGSAEGAVGAAKSARPTPYQVGGELGPAPLVPSRPMLLDRLDAEEAAHPLYKARAERIRDGLRGCTVLGIETSCDDTAAAVVRGDGVVLGESVASQHALHAEWGGVVPSIAQEAHKSAIEETVNAALASAGVEIGDVDCVAVTVGPGLEICLRVGSNFARDLSLREGLPFVAVHHLEAHCLVPRMGQQSPSEGPRFPFLALLVSGGHCQLLLVRGVGEYEVVGGTLDDALGEAYDKVARMLNLEAPKGGGPALEALAKGGDAGKYPLPVPMQQRADCDFSYAGLKTSVRNAIAKLRKMHSLAEEEDLPPQVQADLAASFQESAVRHLEQRLRRALRRLAERPEGGVEQVVMAGGVAANQTIRSRIKALCEKEGSELLVPPPKLCTDNGVMVAWAALERLSLGQCSVAEGQEVHARAPLGPVLAFSAEEIERAKRK